MSKQKPKTKKTVSKASKKKTVKISSAKAPKKKSANVTKKKTVAKKAAVKSSASKKKAAKKAVKKVTKKKKDVSAVKKKTIKSAKKAGRPKKVRKSVKKKSLKKELSKELQIPNVCVEKEISKIISDNVQEGYNVPKSSFLKRLLYKEISISNLTIPSLKRNGKPKKVKEVKIKTVKVSLIEHPSSYVYKRIKKGILEFWFDLTRSRKKQDDIDAFIEDAYEEEKKAVIYGNKIFLNPWGAAWKFSYHFFLLCISFIVAGCVIWGGE